MLEFIIYCKFKIFLIIYYILNTPTFINLKKKKIKEIFIFIVDLKNTNHILSIKNYKNKILK